MRISSIIAALIATAFFILFFTKSRKTGPEVCNQIIWWNNLRPFHGLMYYIFAILANTNSMVKFAYIPLLIDVIIGIIFHIYNKFK